MPLGGTSQLSVAPSFLGQGVALGPGLVQWGPVSFHPHLNYQLSYGNELQPAPGVQVNTLINQLSPGLLLALGSHWSLDYTPTLLFYSDRRIQDGVDHVVNLVGGTTYKDWAFGLRQSYASTIEPLIETGSQISEEAYTTALTAGYQMNSKMSLNFNVDQNFRFIDQQFVTQALSDYHEWSTLDWFNYQFNPRLGAGLGAGFTYDDLSVGSDMTAEQYQGRIHWHPTDKLTLALTAGLEDRQFLSSDVPDLLSPIFSFSTLYQLFETTSFSIAANRYVSPAYFQNAVTEGTTVSAGVRQRLLGRVFLDVSGQYGYTTYHNTGTVGVQVSNYDLASFSVRLSTIFLKRATASVFFQQSYLSSGSGGVASALYNYSTTETGLNLGYRF